MFLTLDSVQFLMKQWLAGSMVAIFSEAVGIAKLYRKGGGYGLWISETRKMLISYLCT